MTLEIRKVDDDVARLQRLIDSAERRLRIGFVRAITRIDDSLVLADLQRLLEAGRIADAVEIGRAHYEQFADEWVEVYVRAGRDTAGFVGRELGIVARFDVLNTRAVQAAQANQLRLVRELLDRQRQTARRVIAEGVRDGINPRQTAVRFRDSIGLTARQESYVSNFRRELEEGNSRALGRRLRDRRFDPTVRRAIAGESLDRDTIDRMVGRYRERWVRFRAETIGRTESLRSTHQGADEMYRQAFAAEELDPEEVRRIWNTARDERVRGSHVAMHLQERRVDQPFTSGLGNSLLHPADPAAPPEDTVNCRCVLSTRIPRRAVR